MEKASAVVFAMVEGGDEEENQVGLTRRSNTEVVGPCSEKSFLHAHCIEHSHEDQLVSHVGNFSFVALKFIENTDEGQARAWKDETIESFCETVKWKIELDISSIWNSLVLVDVKCLLSTALSKLDRWILNF